MTVGGIRTAKHYLGAMVFFGGPAKFSIEKKG
ncbi:hypothetical protein SNOG_16494 [Parastagonospora nodorum SN15]|uniref:Uncharacterized protein n=1 Tax=Phaeosphaeria nodorum (strain SN15 / ATCC MYA-4574 / FGSC 10173) TaxID=321614 RepID=Q0TVH0_PHANO|nr:hypothetical protein SNOG_16494 [Parastagonospora nodorum SN15]EAT76099.1 hypothetical protein SNOG_16494 [Parastagonospora nodorum SN15]